MRLILLHIGLNYIVNCCRTAERKYIYITLWTFREHNGRKRREKNPPYSSLWYLRILINCRYTLQGRVYRKLGAHVTKGSVGIVGSPSDFVDKHCLNKDSREKGFDLTECPCTKSCQSNRPGDSSRKIEPYALLQPMSFSLVGDDRHLKRGVNETQHTLSIFQRFALFAPFDKC